MKKSKFAITADDDTLLFDLWRWKMLTTSMIYLSVYSHRTPTACHKRLTRLEKNGFIESFISRDSKRWFWQLTDKGYKTLNLSEFKCHQSGFRSEHKDHDFLVTLLHFGIWHSVEQNCGAICTEQELRRFDLESYPDWVPHTTDHRPDGYYKTDLSLANDKSLVAIEVELNLKAAQHYVDLGGFYTETVGVYHVIWLVKSEVDAKFILSNLKKGSNQNACEHSFILLSQWFKTLWQTEIFIGKNQGEKIENFLGQSPSKSRSSFTAESLFDFRKTYVNSTVLTNQTNQITAHNKIIGSH